MKPAEVVALFRKVEIGKELGDEYLQERQSMLDQISAEVIDLGVRDSNDQLVGFANIVHKGRSGELTDFVVSPDHQSKGIGRALIDSRLAIAEAANIDSLFISDPEPTNNLRTYYHDQGFQEDAYGDMTRGPEPVSFGTLVAMQQPALAV